MNYKHVGAAIILGFPNYSDLQMVCPVGVALKAMPVGSLE
jgi:hypothetical protein